MKRIFIITVIMAHSLNASDDKNIDPTKYKFGVAAFFFAQGAKHMRINEYQLQVLEYEIERYPDIVPIALKRMRMRTVIEVSKDKFPRFMRELNRVKFEKYAIKESL